MKRWAVGAFLWMACGPATPPGIEQAPAPEATLSPEPVAAATPPPDTGPMPHDRLPDARAVAGMELAEATAGPVIMRTVSLAAGETMELAPSADHEHLVLVLSGEIELAPGEAPGALVKAWYVARARGVPVALRGVTDARLVAALVHGDPLTKRDVEVRNLAEIEELTWADGRAHARLGFEDGRASFGLLYSHHEVGVPRHEHDGSSEVIGLLSGEGTMGIGDVQRKVASGDVFHMPSGVEHDYAPAGTKTLFAVQLYVPPGPEQRFKEMAKKQAAPR